MPGLLHLIPGLLHPMPGLMHPLYIQLASFDAEKIISFKINFLSYIDLPAMGHYSNATIRRFNVQSHMKKSLK